MVVDGEPPESGAALAARKGRPSAPSPRTARSGRLFRLDSGTMSRARRHVPGARDRTEEPTGAISWCLPRRRLACAPQSPRVGTFACASRHLCHRESARLPARVGHLRPAGGRDAHASAPRRRGRGGQAGPAAHPLGPGRPAAGGRQPGREPAARPGGPRPTLRLRGCTGPDRGRASDPEVRIRLPRRPRIGDRFPGRRRRGGTPPAEVRSGHLLGAADLEPRGLDPRGHPGGHGAGLLPAGQVGAGRQRAHEAVAGRPTSTTRVESPRST